MGTQTGFKRFLLILCLTFCCVTGISAGTLSSSSEESRRSNYFLEERSKPQAVLTDNSQTLRTGSSRIERLPSAEGSEFASHHPGDPSPQLFNLQTNSYRHYGDQWSSRPSSPVVSQSQRSHYVVALRQLLC